jgi:glycosyltransferase involved in cell wall biosynthesis/N-acetylneuraminic acid mutarotase
MTTPLISVVVPACNAEATLSATIDSVRRQTLQDFELIVIDDGSTDGTLRCLENVDDPRLRVFSFPNGGLAAARNRGIEKSCGEFITFIDGDDLWTPDKLERQLDALRRCPDAALAYSWTAFIDQRGKYLFAKEPSRAEGDVYAELVRGCFVASGSNILVRKRCVDEVGAFDTTLGAAQDWEFCLRLAARWPFAVVPRYQILYRIWEGAMSANAERCEQACLMICDRAFGQGNLPARRRRESLSNVKQYIAFLYLTRHTGHDLRRRAGRKLAESIRAYPRTLLTGKTLHLLLAWLLLHGLPARRWRPPVMTLLRWHGRWTMIWRREVRELIATRAAGNVEQPNKRRRLVGSALGMLAIALIAGTALAQAPGRWSKAAAMPEERTEVTVAALGGRIYVVGGFGGRGGLLEYDPATDQWRERAKPPFSVHHAGAATVGGRLYVVGGYNMSWEPMDKTFAYDPARDQWREMSPMPTARGALAVALVDGRIHAVGGGGAGRRNTGAHEVYDPGTDRWSSAPPLPTPRDHHAAEVVDGRLYAIGGRIDGSYARNLAVNEEYDPRTRQWRTRAPLPTARSGIAAAVLGGRIFVFGGEAPSGTFEQVEGYDPSADAWNTFSPMPTARHGLGAAALGDRIFVISGGPRPGGSYSPANEVFRP